MYKSIETVPTAWVLTPILFVLSVFIFFIPFITGQKTPAIRAAIKQNMIFMKETVDKFISFHQRPPQTIQELYEDAKNKNYNKTFFNPILKVSGDMNNLQIIVQYDSKTIKNLNKSFKSDLYIGKVGYFTDGKKYVLYGHEKDGALLQEQQELVILSNS